MSNIFRNVTPAIAVMVAGLAGAYLVYDNYFSGSSDTNETIVALEPAAGEESAVDAVDNVTEETMESVAVEDAAAEGVVTFTSGAENAAPVEGAVTFTSAEEGMTTEDAEKKVEGTVEAAPEAAEGVKEAH